MLDQASNRSVAIVGGAGFVGQALLARLAALGIRATVIVRGSSSLVVDTAQHDVLHPSNAESAGGFDLVVNLAYPNSGDPISHPEQNRKIFSTVASLLKPGSSLIHVSTLAVFGYALEREIVAGPVATVRDYAYVETKIEAELHFQKLARKQGRSLDIVRLGNVWGHASGAWAQPIVQRLLMGRPLGVQGVDNYSNTTDVANAAAFLAHLVQRQPQSAADVRFHHLAEFSDVRWSEWINPLAQYLGVEPVYAMPEQLWPVNGMGGEIRTALSPVKPRALHKKLVIGRVAGSYIRTVLRNLPAPVFEKLKGQSFAKYNYPPLDLVDQLFLKVMNPMRQFSLQTSEAWQPVLSREQSLQSVLDWLKEG